MIDFVNLVNYLEYPPKYRNDLMRYHSDIVEYAIRHYVSSHKYRMQVVNCINSISAHVLQGDYISWPVSSPFVQIESVDDSTCRSVLGKLYLAAKDINWSMLVPVDTPGESDVPARAEPPKGFTAPQGKSATASYMAPLSTPTQLDPPTPKADLYLQPPTVPQFSTNKVWMSGSVSGSRMTIYTTLPEVPTKQNEISVTTDLNRLSDRDLLRLYPNRLIQTRGVDLYTPVEGLEFDARLGVILPIADFTPAQVRDNIIRYPHFYHLTRIVNGELVSFYNTMELDGKLENTLDVWDSLPDAKSIPRQAALIRDYVIRRYLLERDVKHVDHTFPMFGALDPFLTLFMPADDYIDFGYTDTLEIVKQCVRARVAFKQTRNPVIRRIQNG